MAATLANKDKEKYSKSFKVFTKTVVERNLDVVLRSCFFKRLSLLLNYVNMAKCIKHDYNDYTWHMYYYDKVDEERE